MHANYHRKDSAIMQEGFQRYRATEDCGSQKCQFYQQRTTHFHCRRTGCNFTFKNKADMEKHKSYHIKDEQLNKDGFKKFMKHEHCSYENCRFSKVCNHIHCIRPGCLYVLHSTGQLYSHKRKHERRDSENAYKKFKEVSFSTTPNGETTRTTTTTMFNQKSGSLKAAMDTSKTAASLPSHLLLSKTLSTVPESMPIMNLSNILGNMNLPSSTQMSTSNIKQEIEASDTTTTATSLTNIDIKTEKPTEQTCQQALSEMLHRKKSREDEEWKNYLIRCHGQQNFVTETQYYTYEANQECEVLNDGQACPHSGKVKHYHCKWPTCKAAVLTGGNPFQRLEHYKLHVNVPSYPTEERFYPVNSDGAFIGYIGRRKRGRPPKNRIMNSALTNPVQRPLFPVMPRKPAPTLLTNTTAENSIPDRKTVPIAEDSDKTLVPPVTLVKKEGSDSYSVFSSDSDEKGFNKYTADEKCPDDRCPFAKKAHYHCKQPNCHHVLEREDLLVLHSKDFHDNIEILDGFAFFDRSVDCRLPSCNSNKVNRHFHCVRPGCNYSFVRYSTMAVHEQRHKNGQLEPDKPPHKKLKLTVHDPTTFQKKTTVMLSNPISQPDAFLNPSSYSGEKSTVKAAGTFFPISTLSSSTQQTSQGSPEPCDEQMSPTEQERKLFYPSETCGRPFCKLRKRDHFHCHMCNQAFSSIDRLRPHLARHEVEHPNNTRLAAALQASSPEHVRSVRPILPKSEVNQHTTEIEKDSNSQNHDNDRSSPSVSPAAISSQPSVSSGFQLGTFPTNLMSMGIGMPQAGAPFMFHPQFLASALATTSSYNSEHSVKTETTSANVNENSVTKSSSATPAALFSPPPGQFIGVLSPGLIPFTLPVPFGMAPGLPLSQATALSQPSTPPTMSTSVVANLGNILPPLDEDTSNNNNNNSEENRGSASLSSDEESEEYTRKQSLTSESDSVSSYTSQKVRQQKKSSPPPTRSSTANKDDFMPEGYVRYRYSEDCQYSRCSYRNQLTHFHCIRDDCGYSFCDRARIVQHTARHERLDTLMANEFQQFRQNMNCKRENCEHITKASHFHCLKCDFTCTDTSKVVAHRRQHAKMDSIAAAGFEKHNAIADCHHDECNYKMKQTHYHCLKCSYSVVGLSSMESHKFKHL